LKFSVAQDGSRPIGGIGFNLGDKLPIVKNGRTFRAVFSIEENEWYGNISLQLKLRDIK
jgi:single-stranded-DNA-specific exonuclease